MVWVWGLTTLSLASCAASATSAIPTSAASADTGKALTGTVVAIRSGSYTAGGNSGLQAVLAALNQAPPGGAVSGQEIVIRLGDGNPVSVAALATPAAPKFAVGDDVAIIEGSKTTLVRRN